MATIISTTLLLSLIFLSMLSPSRSDVLGFSADLIHRDSPASPFYNPSLTRFDHVRNALRRSRDDANHFISDFKNDLGFTRDIVPITGAYIMKVEVGTPPSTRFLIADTGSDITWTQCAPCIECFEQKDPLFDPRKSSTFKAYPYDSAEYKRLGESYKARNDTCGYIVSYADNSYSEGILASETLAPGSNSSGLVFISGITFGCGFKNVGFSSKDATEQSGVLGLGGGPISLASQIKPLIDGKFSYCLTPSFTGKKITSQIKFGKDAVVPGTGVATTPIIPNKTPITFYYLNLEAISVGRNRIELFKSKQDSIDNAGNVIIDLGSTMTLLHNSTYIKFVDLVRKSMGNKTVRSPEKELELCYRISDNPSYPKVKAYFTGASVELKPTNTFIEVGHDVTCLAFAPDEGVQVYGNVAQTNFLINYDTMRGTVSFKPSKCGHVSR